MRTFSVERSDNFETDTEILFQLLARSNAANVATAHYRQPIAQGLALVHAVRCQHNRMLTALAVLHGRPDVAT